MYEQPEVDKLDARTGAIPVIANVFIAVDTAVAAVYDAVVAAYAFWGDSPDDGGLGPGPDQG